jgi:hypothetical protein
MARWSRFFRSASLTLPTLVAFAACGVDLDVHDDDHDHDYDELTWGRGLRQGITVAGAWSPPPDVVATADQQAVDYDGAPPYDGGANCSGGSTPGARVLRDVLIAHYAQIGSIGVYNCRVIAGSNSMSMHGVGRALDIMIPTIAGDANNTAGDDIAHWLMQNAEMLGLQLIIWDHSIWSVSYDGIRCGAPSVAVVTAQQTSVVVPRASTALTRVHARALAERWWRERRVAKKRDPDLG